MSSVMFGAGSLVLKGSDGTAYKVAELQDVSLEFASSTKELVGSSRFPIAIATTAAKVTGKAKNAKIDGRLFATVLGGTSTAGGTVFVDNESHTAATSVDAAQKAKTPVTDYGVLDSSFNPMTLVASAPTTGQYAYASGTYTFAAGQTGNVYLNYSYKETTAGNTVSISNSAMGTGTTYTLEASTTFNGKTLGFTFAAVMVPKLSMAFKNEDFVISDMDFTCIADATGKVVDIYYS